MATIVTKNSVSSRSVVSLNFRLAGGFLSTRYLTPPHRRRLSFIYFPVAFGEGGKAVDAYRNTDTAENGTNVTDDHMYHRAKLVVASGYID